MKKIYENIYQVWLLNKRGNDTVELLIKRANDNTILIVMVSLDDCCVFSYVPCYSYCYGNKEAYDEHIMKAIEVLKNEERQ